MKIAIFSDFHGSSWTQCSKQVKWGDRIINSRLLDHVRILDQIEKYCEQNDIKHVVFGGDMFEERHRVKTEVFNVIFKKLFSMYRKGISLYLLVGNHDQSGTAVNSEHSLKPFSLFCKVLDTPGFTEVADGFKLYHCPFLMRETDVPAEMAKVMDDTKPDSSDICLLHQGVDGASVGSTDFLRQDLKLEDLPADRFQHIFLGHYHLPQDLSDNVTYIGATHQTKWGESGQQRGFLEYNIDSGVYTRIATAAPQFIRINQQEMAHFDFESHINDFIRIEVGQDVTKLEKDAIKSAYPDTFIEFIPAPIEVSTASEVTLTLSMSREEMIEEYVRAEAQEAPKDINKEFLIEAGRAFLQGKIWAVNNGVIKAEDRIA